MSTIEALDSLCSESITQFTFQTRFSRFAAIYPVILFIEGEIPARSGFELFLAQGCPKIPRARVWIGLKTKVAASARRPPTTTAIEDCLQPRGISRSIHKPDNSAS